MANRGSFTAASVLALGLLTATCSARAETLPRLEATSLYSQRAHGCYPVDLATWKHATKAVLVRNEVALLSLELCNDKVYPIFHVDFRYDPTLVHNNNYFIPLYRDMIRANGGYPLAFVANGTIVYVEMRNGTISEDQEAYAP